MSAQHVLVALLGIMLSLPAPLVNASSECEAAQTRLAAAVAESPRDFTDDVAQALIDTIDACEDTNNNDSEAEKVEPAADARSPVPPTIPCAGELEGNGPMYVLIAMPFVPAAEYVAQAEIHFERSAGGFEIMTARSANSTGFDASTTSGVIYVAGVPIPATDWGVGSTCNAGGTPCRATGYAAHVIRGSIQVWMASDVEVCT